MPTVKALDHVNIQTEMVAETARFFAEVLDLDPRPAFSGAAMDQVTWMFDAAGRPLVHITRPGATFAADAAPAPRAGTGAPALRTDTGALHHVAFECEGHDEMLARLGRLGHPFRCRDIASAGLKQIFVSEPNGVLLELNFRESPAVSA